MSFVLILAGDRMKTKAKTVFSPQLFSFIALTVCMPVVAFANDNEPEELTLPSVQKTKIQILDPDEQAASIHLITSRYTIVLKKFESKQKRYAFMVPDGKYVIQDINGKLYPIVVGYSQYSRGGRVPIKLTISPRPEEDEGWAWIPDGPALIGDELGVGAEDERPARTEYVSAFWLQKHEVTNQQYAAFLTAQEEIDPRWIDLNSRKCRIKRAANAKGEIEPATYTSDAPMHPVVMVSHLGAEAYCQWLTSETGRTHRLPTEIEWEKAARGPKSNIYSYGSVYRQDGANQESGTIKPVKQYRPNEYGLFDMTGNVFEWMSNKYDPKQQDNSMNQSLRGGSFVLDGMYLRNSFRMRQSPTVMTDDIGFRVLRETIQKEEK